MFVLAGSGILISGRTGVKVGCQCHRSYHGDTPPPSIFSPAVVRALSPFVARSSSPTHCGSRRSPRYLSPVDAVAVGGIPPLLGRVVILCARLGQPLARNC